MKRIARQLTTPTVAAAAVAADRHAFARSSGEEPVRPRALDPIQRRFAKAALRKPPPGLQRRVLELARDYSATRIDEHGEKPVLGYDYGPAEWATLGEATRAMNLADPERKVVMVDSTTELGEAIEKEGSSRLSALMYVQLTPETGHELAVDVSRREGRTSVVIVDSNPRTKATTSLLNEQFVSELPKDCVGIYIPTAQQKEWQGCGTFAIATVDAMRKDPDRMDELHEFNFERRLGRADEAEAIASVGMVVMPPHRLPVDALRHSDDPGLLARWAAHHEDSPAEQLRAHAHEARLRDLQAAGKRAILEQRLAILDNGARRESRADFATGVMAPAFATLLSRRPAGENG